MNSSISERLKLLEREAQPPRIIEIEFIVVDGKGDVIRKEEPIHFQIKNDIK